MTFSFFALLALLPGPQAQALELYGPEAGVVPFGMGRAYSAVADDGLSLYYNPAGLALVSKVDLQLFDVKLGANKDVVENYKLLSELGKSSQSSLASPLSRLAGKHLMSVVSNSSQITVPNAALGINYDAHTDFDLQNLAYPTTRMRYTRDFSVLLGTGVALGGKRKDFRVGAVLKWISRQGGEKDVPISQISGNKSSLKDIFTSSGSGIGGDIGAQLRLPTAGRVDYTIAFVWHDIGQTSFGKSTAVNPPTRIRDNMVAGIAARFPIGGQKNRRLERRYGPGRSSSSFTIAYDYSHLNIAVGKEPPLKHSHFGANLDLPILSLQLGLNQTSLTFGTSFDIGIVKVALATYGEDIGSYASQRTDRRYLLSVGSSFGFGGF